MPPNLIQSPPDRWLERLRRGNRVWLPKEQQEATVEWPYEPSEPGYICGRIGIRRGYVDSWIVDANGKGIDQAPILLPIEGQLPDNPEPLPEPIIRHLEREVERLNERVRYLERRVLTGLVPDVPMLMDPTGVIFVEDPPPDPIPDDVNVTRF